MNESTIKEEVTLTEAKDVLNSWWAYLSSKWLWILIIAIISGLGGIYYAYIKKPVYTAELTFAAESGKGSMAAYASIASQFGLNMGGGNAFEGDNLIYLFKSWKLVNKTLLTPVEVEGKKQLLVEYFIKNKQSDNKKAVSSPVSFSSDQKPGNRLRDSLMKIYYHEIISTLEIFRMDRRIDIIFVRIQSENELFAKMFIEILTNNAVQYFVEYRSKKARYNVILLQRQTDSIRRLISGGITSIAATNDLNVNPIRQVMQTGVQKKGIDVQVNSALYTELAKNLQASGMVLRQETPFIEVVDTPFLPLDKKKFGKAKGAIIFAFGGGFLAVAFFVVKRMILNFKKRVS